jgi:hypothetical protein
MNGSGSGASSSSGTNAAGQKGKELSQAPLTSDTVT